MRTLHAQIQRKKRVKILCMDSVFNVLKKEMNFPCLSPMDVFLCFNELSEKNFCFSNINLILLLSSSLMPDKPISTELERKFNHLCLLTYLLIDF